MVDRWQMEASQTPGSADRVATVRARVDALLSRLARRPHFAVSDEHAAEIDNAFNLTYDAPTFPAFAGEAIGRTLEADAHGDRMREWWTRTRRGAGVGS